jgi:hypothetical protein
LIAKEAVKRKLVPKVGRETIRVLLLSHEFKPWREKNVVGARTQRTVHRQNAGHSETYERPYDPREPVICLDEKSVTLQRPAPFTGRPGPRSAAGQLSSLI